MFDLIHTQNQSRKRSNDAYLIDFKQSGVTKATKAKAIRDLNNDRKTKKLKKKVKDSNAVASKSETVQGRSSTKSTAVGSVASGLTNTPKGALSAHSNNQSVSQTQPPSISATVPATTVPEIRKQASNLYYPDLPMEERVAKLISEGNTNEQVAMRLDVSLKKVMELRKVGTTKSLIRSPRELFASRLTDFNDAFDTAKSIYFDDPTSEVSYRVMTEFAKTMRELVKDYNDLEDPNELATQIIQMAIRPTVMKVLGTVVAGLKTTLASTLPFLKDHEKTLLIDGVNNSIKQLQAQVNNDYNKSVETLEQIFDIQLSSLKIHRSEEIKDNKDQKDTK